MRTARIKNISIVTHAKGCPGIRFFGLGPQFIPVNGINQIEKLFNNYAFWATKRDKENIKRMLSNSSAVITIWERKKLIAFGRALSDGVYRAVLWDVIVAEEFRQKGIGKKLIDSLLKTDALKGINKIYVMTTHCSKFYSSNHFQKEITQSLLIKTNNENYFPGN